MKLSWLLFDLDNTLVDFTEASKMSFFECFDQIGRECSAEIYGLYKEINSEIWTQFENREITAIELRTARFQRLFNRLEISGVDYHHFSKDYLNGIVNHSMVYEGVVEMLRTLKKYYKISVVTNGLKEVQRPRLHRLGMTDLFDSIVVSDEIGFAKPQEAFFEYTMTTIDRLPPKDEIMIIGDSMNSDIKGGYDFGIRTCFVKNQRSISSNHRFKADFEIENVLGLQRVLGVV